MENLLPRRCCWVRTKAFTGRSAVNMCKTWRPKTRRFLWVCRHHLDVSLRRLLQHVFFCRSASPPTEKWFHMFISSNCFERSNCPTHISPIQLIKLTRRTHRRGRQIITLTFRTKLLSLLAASLQAPPSPYPLYSLLIPPFLFARNRANNYARCTTVLVVYRKGRLQS